MEKKYTFNGEDFVLCKLQGHMFWGRYNSTKSYINLYRFIDENTAPSIFFDWIKVGNESLEILH